MLRIIGHRNIILFLKNIDTVRVSFGNIRYPSQINSFELYKIQIILELILQKILTLAVPLTLFAGKIYLTVVKFHKIPQVQLHVA